ncbi:hypothetical protein B5F98_11685 [Pseudoflavonifractor sp. An44]|uniref:AbiH family protein n=1 Tax=Pseudoflavonifractor sp. An44 TaxID=1965635 RepID=UPI000B38B41E|nr:AbiH family protein [Pseudoflavonifractor sp. An44]OUN92040.1 hypothetical protein B5F98_11685 [Pseudoflavonifractor sp. An44]
MVLNAKENDRRMNITFLIGNGFDLNLGLSTKYEHFLKEYVRSESENYVIERFKQNILEESDSWASAEEAFGKYTAKYYTNGAIVFCNCHEDFCEKLARYLQEEESWLQLDETDETSVKKFAAAISFPNFIQGFREVQQQEIQQVVAAHDGGFVYNFINFNYTTTLDQYLEAVNNTPGLFALRKYRGTSYSSGIGQCIHVHGTTSSDMVLGVNDETQIAAPEIFSEVGEEYKYQIIKQKTNEMNEQNVDTKTATLLAQSQLIYIYGMSLGRTDALWWNRIIDLMLKNPDLHVIIHCFDGPKDTLIQRRIQTFNREKRREFLAYSNEEQKQLEQLENRIHIDRTNIFASLKDVAKERPLPFEEIDKMLAEI